MPYFTYFVPADWNRTGSGYGGSGGVEGSGDHTYELPDGGSLEITVETDSYLSAEPVDANSSPWASWDYTHHLVHR